MPIHAPGLVAIFGVLEPRKPVGNDSTVDEIIGVVWVCEELDEEENGFHGSPDAFFQRRTTPFRIALLAPATTLGASTLTVPWRSCCDLLRSLDITRITPLFTDTCEIA